MTEIADRYRKVADGFQARVEGVAADGWDAPAPCEGWTARDILDHIGQTTGFFLGRAGIEPSVPPASEDPVATWTAARAAMEGVLADPSVAGQEVESPFGKQTLEELIGNIGCGDLLVHTWDLARATGQDETLDPDAVERTMAMMEPNDAMMRGGSAFGPRVPVPADADPQTQLIAFTGRTP
jgi:uncharacterized protein (TIGR03086 family)